MRVVHISVQKMSSHTSRIMVIVRTHSLVLERSNCEVWLCKSTTTSFWLSARIHNRCTWRCRMRWNTIVPKKTPTKIPISAKTSTIATNIKKTPLSELPPPPEGQSQAQPSQLYNTQLSQPQSRERRLCRVASESNEPPPQQYQMLPINPSIAKNNMKPEM